MSEVDIDPNARPALSRTFRLQFEKVQDAWVLLYPEGMVKLNPSAAEILKRCDGRRSVDDIVAELVEAFDMKGDEERVALTADVNGFLKIARQQKWVSL